MKEIWRPVVGYENWYEVSDKGRVRRSFNRFGEPCARVLKPMGGKSYQRIGLYRDKKSRRDFHIHTLVAAAFIGPRPPGLQINHKNGVKADNRAGNLEYVTPGENTRHAYVVLGYKPPPRPGMSKGTKNPATKLSDDDVRKIRRLYATGNYTQAEIGNLYGLGSGAVSHIVTRRSWPHVK